MSVRIHTTNRLSEDKKYSFNYGQIAQDFCINRMLDIDNGFFLDIGAGIGGLDAKKVLINSMSNTYGLERFRGWNGIAIDYDETYIQEAKKHRSCIMVCEDLTKININDILEKNNAPKKMDYLSFDVDDVQEKVLNELDFSTYNFKTITYEHNLYLAFNPAGCHLNTNVIELYKKSREKFSSLGYRLLFGNVGVFPGLPIEDWYVDRATFKKYEHLASDNVTSRQVVVSIERSMLKK